MFQECNFSKGSCLADSPDERFCGLAGLAAEEALHAIRGTLHEDVYNGNASRHGGIYIACRNSVSD